MGRALPISITAALSLAPAAARCGQRRCELGACNQPHVSLSSADFSGLAVHRVVKLLHALVLTGLRAPCREIVSAQHFRVRKAGRTAVLFDHLLLLRELRLHGHKSAQIQHACATKF